MQALLLTGCLILYGSFYPFNFTAAPPNAIAQLFSTHLQLRSIADFLGNVGLFVPWGLAAMRAGRPHMGFGAAFLVTVLGGALLALFCQVGQIWLPTRHAALVDVLANLIGTIAGALAGWYLVRAHARHLHLRIVRLVPAVLLGGLVLTQWLPLVPSLDLQLVLDQSKALAGKPDGLSVPFFTSTALAMLAGHLIALFVGLPRSRVLLPFLLLALTGGALFLQSSQASPSSALGFVVGSCIWWHLARASEAHRDAKLLMLLLLMFTLGALAPFRLRDAPVPFSWLPFSEMLRGSMIDNLRALVGNLVMYGGMLHILFRVSGRCIAASVVLSAWVGLLEFMQTMIDTRTPDLTQPLLVLMLGLAIDGLSRRDKATAPTSGQPVAGTPPAAVRPFTGQTDTAGLRRPASTTLALQLAGLTIVLTTGFSMLLKIPGIPYNVSELFRAGGSIPALMMFSLALLWAGAGAAWLGLRISASRWPAPNLPWRVLLVCLVSLALLWSAVTTESIMDISGSANRYWFVTNKDIWGPGWRKIFLHLDSPQSINFIEHCVRYSALYAPLPIFLGLLITIQTKVQTAQLKGWHLAGLMVIAASLLWLSKAIAFDWTSTDNLNELISRDGPWGWGGGGFLYALLLLFCANALMVALAADRSLSLLVLAVAATLLSIPVGWWLLNQGLAQNISKYGNSFSGTQFLLGPDRRALLGEEVLFLRWGLVHSGSVAILAAGVWLGQRMFAVDSSNTRPMVRA